MTSCVYRNLSFHRTKWFIWKSYNTKKVFPICSVPTLHSYSTNEENNPPHRRNKFMTSIGLKNWKLYPTEFLLKNLRPDKVPPSYRMCYRSGLETYANFCILLGSFTTVLYPPGLLYLLFQANTVETAVNLEVAILSVGLFVSIFAMYFFSLKVPLRIYYSVESNDFILFLPKLIPYATKMIVVKPGQVLPPTKSSKYLPWQNIEYTHKETKQKMWIVDEKFVLPMYYNKFMGYWHDCKAAFINKY